MKYFVVTFILAVTFELLKRNYRTKLQKNARFVVSISIMPEVSIPILLLFHKTALNLPLRIPTRMKENIRYIWRL